MSEYYPFEVMRAVKMATKKGYYSDGDDIGEWRKSFVGRFLTKWPNAGKTLDVFSTVLGHEPTWEDITDSNLRDLREALAQGRCPSSVKTLCAQVKAVINANNYEVRKDKDPLAVCDISRSLKVKRSPSEAVYLTQAELERFNKVKALNGIEQYVKRVFMVEALTGARHIDAERITLDHVNKRSKTVTYRAVKTGNQVVVPLHKWLMQYLTRNDVEGYVKRMATFNDTLRSLCCRAGINENVTLTRRGEEQQGPKWEFVSSHTGRRTFATLLFLHGSSVTTIAQLMGHSNPQITWRNYICAEREIDENTLRFFN